MPVNIWTHLGGAVFFAILLVLTLGKVMSHHTTVTWHDAAGFAVFLVATVICLSLSAAYHTSRCHSPTVSPVQEISKSHIRVADRALLLDE